MKTSICCHCNLNCMYALRIPKERGYKSCCLMIGMDLISCLSLRRGIGYSTLYTEIYFVEEIRVCLLFDYMLLGAFGHCPSIKGGKKLNKCLVSTFCFF